MPKDSLTVTDNRTGKTYELAIADGTIKAMDLASVKANEEDFGLMTYFDRAVQKAYALARSPAARALPGHRG